MADEALRVQTEAANAYESLFVPALFAEWAPVVAAATHAAPGHHVLDVACGTGVLAREFAARVGAAGSVTGLDANPGMLAVARRIAPAIEWRQGMADALPFEDAAFDALGSQFGMMFFPDRAAALREMARVLRPGGRVAVAVWDSLANTPAYAAEVALVERIAGAEAAAPLRAPFVLGDRAHLAALFAEAGWPAAEVTAHRGTGRFPSVRVMVEADVRGWLPLMGVVLGEDVVERILRDAEHDLREFVTGDGSVAFDSPILLAAAAKR